MPTYLYPGVHVQEKPESSRNIIAVSTSITAFIGRTQTGPTNTPFLIKNYSDFERTFGGLWDESPMTFAVMDFFNNGGKQAYIIRVDCGPIENYDIDRITARVIGNEKNQTGLYSLNESDVFNILCIPPLYKDRDIDKPLITAAAEYCEQRRAILILDCPKTWKTSRHAVDGMKDIASSLGTDSKNAAVYFPRVQKPNPFQNNKIETFPACGAIAGVIARTDSGHGVWKAPAGKRAGLKGVVGLPINVTGSENKELNESGCNCLRVFPNSAPVVWGARTLQGNDRLNSEWEYLQVRRLALFIEESLYRGTQWAAFEPNDEPLWAQLRSNIGAFMYDLFKSGAFCGRKPSEAYLVKCGGETTTQEDIKTGIVNILVGFAPVKPAEFLILKLGQPAGQTE
jgi:uncharacterized protein